jgi:prolyl 4-hydroxylase
VKKSREAWPERNPLWIDDFLSQETCAVVLEELEISFWRPSLVVRRNPKGLLRLHRSRRRVSESSSQEWFSPELLRELRRIETRLARLLGRPRERYETWQATRYDIGGKFDLHYDCGCWQNEPEGEREATVLIYLDSPSRGGGTCFPELGLEVEARAGRLLVWKNLLADGECDPRMIHSSLPLRRGRKTTLVTWIRQREIRTGTRSKG